MDRSITYTITEDYTTIKHFLRAKRYPRAILMQLKYREASDRPQVLLNGIPQPLWKPLHRSDTLEILIKEEKTGSIQLTPLPLPLKIAYEDEDILIVDKAAGMSIHPSFNHYEDSLANAVLDYYGRQKESIVFRCVNRLDKETSGLTIIAKNRLSAAILGIDVKNKDIYREYRALVEGSLPVDGLWHKIDAPIGRVPGSALMRQVDYEGGKRAVTWYQAIASKEDMSLVRLKLESGRTHQIRVHMGYIGHPLPGDYLYNPVYERVKRVPLHSYRLRFRQPVTGGMVDVRSEVPGDVGLLFL